jgi:hypothetical protein
LQRNRPGRLPFHRLCKHGTRSAIHKVEASNIQDSHANGPSTHAGRTEETLEYSEFIANGVWPVDDVLRPIYEEESEKAGKEFVYPADKE